MSSRITINEERVNGIYERIMDEIYLLFHNHPLSFPTGPISESDLVEMNYYQAMGRSFYQSLSEDEKTAVATGEGREYKAVQQKAQRFNPQINPKFAHLPRSSRTR